MSKDRFTHFLPWILKWETVFKKGHYGDYSYAISENDPSDPGGLTKFGIDKASHPGININRITLESATNIYWQEWQKDDIESLKDGLGEVFFNACINCGRGRANQFLHNPGHPNDGSGFLDAQEAYYKRLVNARPSLGKFLTGWLNRTADLRKYLNL
jgi:hypothetical protein